jgi:AcrR family transcriptional regulator
MSDEKMMRAIEAAADVFLRYGYVRTTMGDIAKAATMSRPALYLLFPGKEQAFSAATMHLAKLRLEEIRAAVEACSGIQKQLITGCTMLLVRVFELQQTTPDARDMDDLSFPVVREIYAIFVRFFAELIEAGVANLPAPPADIARALLFALRGLRDVAESQEDYSRMIDLHISLLCETGLSPGDQRCRPA